MIGKAPRRTLIVALLVFMIVSAYLVVHRLRRIQIMDNLIQENSAIEANIASVLQDLVNMETGQRGYLLTGNPEYLQPYAEAKARIGPHLIALRSQIAAHTETERSLEARLESLARGKQLEMERTISLRREGYRHRAFTMVDTNEGKDYMDEARGLTSSLSSFESTRSTGLQAERKAQLSSTISEDILVNSCLVLLGGFLFGLIHYQDKYVEQDAARGRRTLSICESQLGKLTSALSNETYSIVADIEMQARLLLETYGGFLPRYGHEHAQNIMEAAAQMERLRSELLAHAISHSAKEVA